MRLRISETVKLLYGNSESIAKAACGVCGGGGRHRRDVNEAKPSRNGDPLVELTVANGGRNCKRFFFSVTTPLFEALTTTRLLNGFLGVVVDLKKSRLW